MAAKKKASKKAAPKVTGVKAQMTKSEMLGEIADKTGLTKKEVASVMDELGTVINRHVKKGAVGSFVLPGLLKIVTQRKPAQKSRKMISPFTGEEIMTKPKPARTVVKVRPLKALKDMVA